jgi:1,4-alpha-glucan branching enzyme
MAESYGAFALVLHSHLPYVLSHDRLEEEWLMEAVAESYLPLLQVFIQLSRRGISPKVTIGFTPVLLAQLTERRFPATFLTYLGQRVQAAQDDRTLFRHRNEPHLARLAGLWEEFYRRTASFVVHDLSRDVVGAFRRLHEQGHVEMLASAATHAYLPLLGLDTSVRAQVEIGTAVYQRHFHSPPRGFWLPECAYRPAGDWTPPIGRIDGLHPGKRQAIDEMLAAAGINYFFIDERQLRRSPPDYDRHSPCHVYWVDGKSTENPRSVAVFARDFITTARVWQHDGGYPGDPAYLEFHKKRGDGGLRYWRITDRRADLAYKQPYIPEWAFAQTQAHATHFAQVLRARLRHHWQQTGEQGIVVAAFDTELFGHWWFEGPQWASEFIRQLTANGEVSLTTCGEYLQHHRPQHTVQLAESSWGDGGDHRVWWQTGTRDVWRDLYQAEYSMQRLEESLHGKKLDRQLTRIVRQAGRELLLLQSSDWPFMISTRNTPDHARRRVAFHYANFQQCCSMAERYRTGATITEEDWNQLAAMEQQDALFGKLDLRAFWGDEPPAFSLQQSARQG